MRGEATGKWHVGERHVSSLILAYMAYLSVMVGHTAPPDIISHTDDNALRSDCRLVKCSDNITPAQCQSSDQFLML